MRLIEFLIGHNPICNMICYKQAPGVLQVADVIDPQTEADRSAQRCIISSLQKQFPKVQIFGEEVVAFVCICITKS